MARKKSKKKTTGQHAGRGGPGLTTKTAAGLNRTTVYFDDEERKALKHRAVEEDTTMTTLLRLWVREKLRLPKIEL